MRLVGVLVEQAGERRPRSPARAAATPARRATDSCACRAGRRLLVGEAALRIVELHRRHAEVGEDHVRGRRALRRPAPAAARRSCRCARRRSRGRIPRRAAALRCAAARSDRRRDRSAVRPAARARESPARGRRRRACSRPRRRPAPAAGTSSTSADHDRPMGARRRLAGGEHLLHVGGIPLRLQLLVLLLEAARMLARIARAPRRPAGASADLSCVIPVEHLLTGTKLERSGANTGGAC